jgi:dCMP deaminase
MRPNWPMYFTAIAKVVASRATCNRAAVGCVVVSRNQRILSTGYNGSVSGSPHCDDAGHLMLDGHCVRTNHAEANAVAMAASSSVSLQDSTAYITLMPCLTCARLLVSAGVTKIVYEKAYANLQEPVLYRQALPGVVFQPLYAAEKYCERVKSLKEAMKNPGMYLT